MSFPSLPRCFAPGLLLAAITLALAGCGGGGGGGAATPAVPPVSGTPSTPTTPTTPSTPEVPVTPTPPADTTPPVPTFIAGSRHAEGLGYSGDGTGSGATFGIIAGLAMDRAGNIFVSDAGTCTIRKIAAGGVVTTFAGQTGRCGDESATVVPADGIGSAARFYLLGRLVIDGQDNLYVVDGGAVRKITPQAVVTTLTGTLKGVEPIVDGPAATARFLEIRDIALAPDGTLLVVDHAHAWIDFIPLLCAETKNYDYLRTISPQGAVATLQDSWSNCQKKNDSLLAQARNLAYDKRGNLYFTRTVDHKNNFVRQSAAGAPAFLVDANGAAIDDQTPNELPAVDSLAVDDAGNVLYTREGRILKITPDGKRTVLLSGDPNSLPLATFDSAPHNLLYIGGHDFLFGAEGRVFRVTLQ